MNRIHEPHYVYYIPNAEYIGRTLKRRQVKMLASGPLYDNGIQVRKQEHITSGRISKNDKVLKLAEVRNYEHAHMLEQLLITDLYDDLSNNTTHLNDSTYSHYMSRISRLKVINYDDILNRVKKIKKFQKGI